MECDIPCSCSAHVRHFFAYNDFDSLSALRTFLRVLWIVYHVPKDGKSTVANCGTAAPFFITLDYMYNVFAC
jgi:hypothetical protein